MWDSASSGPTYQISNNLSGCNTCGIHTRYATFFCDFDLMLMSREMPLTKLVLQWTIEKLNFWLVSRLCRSSHQRCSKKEILAQLNFAKFLRTSFLQNTHGRLPLDPCNPFKEFAWEKIFYVDYHDFLIFLWVFANLSKKWSKLEP